MRPLPVELELEIVEVAALSYVPSKQRWVASLCLVCCAFKAVVEPILYDFVSISASNIQNVRFTSEYSKLFSRTRRLVILPSALLSDLGDWPGDDEGSTLLAAFTAVQHFYGCLPHLTQMQTAHLRLLTLEFTEPWDRYVLRTKHTANITHLHIASIYDSWDEWSLTNCTLLTHVAFDLAPFEGHAQSFDERTLEHLCYYLRAERLHRLLFRIRHPRSQDAPWVRETLRKFATEHKLVCIWLDDIHEPDDGEIDTLPDEDLDPLTGLSLARRDVFAVRDVLQGEDLFMAGVQIYTSEAVAKS